MVFDIRAVCRPSIQVDLYAALHNLHTSIAPIHANGLGADALLV